MSNTVHYVAKTKFVVLWAASSAAFLAALHHQLTNHQFEGLAVIAASVLALLFAFSALLFNRGRAFPAGSVQRRSLFAAEHATRAAVSFMVGIAISLIVGTGLWYTKAGNLSTLRGIDLLVVLGAPVIFVLTSFREFFIALHVVNSQLFRKQSGRTFLRGLH
jgi:hypothetical protein